MPALPRGTCSVCRRSVPVRVNGDAREHRPSSNWRDQAKTCAGSGKPTSSASSSASTTR